MELYPEAIDEVFAIHNHQCDVLIGLYKLIYNGAADENRPDWYIIESIDGWPTMGPAISQYIWRKFMDFDKMHHPEVLPGGFWMNRGWSTDEDLGAWDIVPAPATLL